MARKMSDDLLAALVATPLSDFEEKRVIQSAIEMPNGAGGLRESMKFAPIELHHDDEGYMVLHWRVRKVRFDEVKDTEDLCRVHVLDVDDATIVDEKIAEKHLRAARLRLQKLREQAQGIAQLDIPGDDEDEGDETDGTGDE